jgi:enoyl-CoA hydratase/carnithine racemase
LRGGLVSRLVDDADWRRVTREVAAVIADRPAVAQQLVKELVGAAFESPLRTGLQYERAAFAVARSSEDAQEGIDAFLDKRKPAYRHR